MKALERVLSFALATALCLCALGWMPSLQAVAGEAVPGASGTAVSGFSENGGDSPSPSRLCFTEEEFRTLMEDDSVSEIRLGQSLVWTDTDIFNPIYYRTGKTIVVGEYGIVLEQNTVLRITAPNNDRLTFVGEGMENPLIEVKKGARVNFNIRNIEVNLTGAGGTGLLIHRDGTGVNGTTITFSGSGFTAIKAEGDLVVSANIVVRGDNATAAVVAGDIDINSRTFTVEGEGSVGIQCGGKATLWRASVTAPERALEAVEGVFLDLAAVIPLPENVERVPYKMTAWKNERMGCGLKGRGLLFEEGEELALPSFVKIFLQQEDDDTNTVDIDVPVSWEISPGFTTDSTGSGTARMLWKFPLYAKDLSEVIAPQEVSISALRRDTPWLATAYESGFGETRLYLEFFAVLDEASSVRLWMAEGDGAFSELVPEEDFVFDYNWESGLRALGVVGLEMDKAYSFYAQVEGDSRRNGETNVLTVFYGQDGLVLGGDRDNDNRGEQEQPPGEVIIPPPTPPGPGEEVIPPVTPDPEEPEKPGETTDTGDPSPVDGGQDNDGAGSKLWRASTARSGSVGATVAQGNTAQGTSHIPKVFPPPQASMEAALKLEMEAAQTGESADAEETDTGISSWEETPSDSLAASDAPLTADTPAAASPSAPASSPEDIVDDGAFGLTAVLVVVGGLAVLGGILWTAKVLRRRRRR
ncbi:MAG: hypothetical protein ACK5LX_16960 [Oscillospiraceae bacterium]